MSEIIRGTQLAQSIQDQAKKRIEKMKHPPGLAAVLVGDDKASHLYVELKEQAAKDVGIYFEKVLLPKDAKEKTIIQKINELNKRDDIHGILVQLPLPDQNEDKIIAAISPEKDVDGFHPENRERLKSGAPGLVPPVALAILRLIASTRQPLRDKHAVVVSNNEIFANAVIQLMKEQGVAGTFVPRDANAIEAKLRVADIIVVAVGKRGFLTKDMVKEGAIVIDVGTNKRKTGGIVGDAAKEVLEVAAFKSPVPGGVGPLTVAYLLNNVVKAAVK